MQREERVQLSAPIAAVLVATTLWQARETWLRSSQLLDFGALYLSGLAARTGLDPYAHATKIALAAPFGVTGFGTNANPPCSLLLLAPLSLVDPHPARWALAALTVGLVVAALWPELRDRPRWWWAVPLCGAPLWTTIALGQIYGLLLGLAALADAQIGRRRGWLGGLAAGTLVAFKPNFAAWLLILAIAGERRLVAIAVATGAAWWGLAALVFGVAPYAGWWANVTAIRGRYPIAGGPNASIVLALGDLDPRLRGSWLTILLVGAAATWAWRRRPPPRVASEVGLAIAILAAPIAWVGYDLLLLPAIIRRMDRPAGQLAAVASWIPWTIWCWFYVLRGPLWPLTLVYPAIAALIVLDAIRGPVDRAPASTSYPAPAPYR